MCKIWRQSDKYFQRYAPETNCLRTAQRRHIIIFSSATLRIEFRLKIFQPVHYPPGSNPHTKNFYPSLFSYKVIGKRRGKKKTVVEYIAPSVSPTVTAGAKNSSLWPSLENLLCMFVFVVWQINCPSLWVRSLTSVRCLTIHIWSMSVIHNLKSENWCLKSTIGSLMYEV